jgi:RimJ/RimL family protein N-acetyltransferase
MIELKPMSEKDFNKYLEVALSDYAQEHVKGGRWTAEEAPAAAQAELKQILPDGLATENHHFYNIVAEEESQPVGILWFAVRNQGGLKAFIYDVLVYESFRRRGYATQTFMVLEDKVRQLGLDTISLHVFGHNHAARALYQKLGYTETNVMMAKTLSDDSHFGK